ncbi:MAG: GTP 3',8-cyclase MoaA [Pyrinomonadaceae bacterium]|nr:GTP 3',8-cyclase MoaA [Pyrinomonadaceae bacterium]
MLRDAYNRTIRDLRISVTDRCNFRCFYCLPNGEPPMARKDTILTFEETAYVADIFVSLGIEKIRLTGGEPLLRKDIATLAAEIAVLKPRLKDLALTTNGFIFPGLADELHSAGVDRVTISLDSLDRDKFIKMTGVDGLEKVFAAIESAKRAGFDPVKVNAAVIRGHNDDEFVEFARFAREFGVSMRFIEFMPLDSGHEWNRDLVVPGREIFETINAVYPLKLRNPDRGSETAWKYVFADGSPGEIGIIAPVTEMFCGACSRIRLTADGQIRTCLFSTTEHDLRGVLRSGVPRAEIARFIESVVLNKEPRHRINDADFVQPSRTMSFIGG